MSIAVMNAVWTHAPVQSGEFTVLLALADFADENGSCFPSIATLAAKARLKDRQAQNCLRALTDAGFVRIERGAGPRGCNRYVVDVDAIEAQSIRRQDAAGGANIAPPQSATEEVQPSASGGAMECTQTIIEPPVEPSPEREARGRDQSETGNEKDASIDDPAKFEKRVKRLAADLDWPGWANSSTAWTVAQFAKLTDAERAEAERRAGQYRSTTGSKALSLGTYFAERKWTALPEPADEQPTAVEARPFGPIWGGAVFRALLSPPQPAPAPSSDFIAKLLQQQDAQGHAERMRRQAEFGWPKVKGWYEQADSRKGFTLPYEDRGLGELMEAVPVDSPVFAAWREEFERRGWPWLPDTGAMRVVYFPKGGPAGLGAFGAAVKGEAVGEAAE